MGFKGLDINIHYDSEVDDLVNDFFNPILSESKEYYRIAGFFNSKSLSLSARGLKEFILNKGKMKLLCGAQLESEDVKSIMVGETNPEDIITSNFFNDLDNIEDDIKFHHVQVLGWMIANKLLEIKIVITFDSEMNNSHPKGIMHYKTGINRDFDGNYISFTGSINATGAAWNDNLEQFDVYRSWNHEQNKYIDNNIDLFLRTWEGKSSQYDVISVPQAVKDKLIDISPKKFEDLKFDEKIIKEISEDSSKPQLFDNQILARDAWFNNGKKGIFSMATGTGKTFTALGCLEKVLDEEEKVLTFICVPYKHLVQQWIKSINDFQIDKKVDKIIIVNSSNHKGKKQMKNAILNVNNEYMDKIIIISTPQSMSKPNFINIIKEYYLNIPYFLIADEMHELGAYEFQKALLNEYNYRLGLSATPERVYDDVGTDFLFNYFDKCVYSFSLKDALTKINPRTGISYLTPFKYYPIFINLNHWELKKYQELTKNLMIELNKKKKNIKNLQKIAFDRANIIKNAKNKLQNLDEILSYLGADVENLIIYCSDKQIKEVLNIVGNKHNIKAKKFTYEESADPEEKYEGLSFRDDIIKKFSVNEYQCLVAMHCLDEGVDIPSASKAILLCNSTNPREFIQRLGRILRRHHNKDMAEVYDFIIKPNLNSDFKETENDIFKKELKRSEEIAKLAINKTEVYKKLYN